VKHRQALERRPQVRKRPANTSALVTRASGFGNRNPLIPFLNQTITLSASLAVRLYCLRFAFAYSID